MTKRISWTDYYLTICDAVSSRADCTRRQVGAVVVKDNSIIATGYNGAAPGQPGCLSDGACPRGKHYKRVAESRPAGFAVVTVVCGGCDKPWPCPESAAPLSSYDTGAGSCIALHAEVNACVRAGVSGRGGVLYCTDEPCDGCVKVMKATGIAQVVWYGGTLNLRPVPARKFEWPKKLTWW